MASATSSGSASASAPEQVICSFKLDPLTPLPVPNSDKSIEAFRQFIGNQRRFEELQIQSDNARQAAIAAGSSDPDSDPSFLEIERELVKIQPDEMELETKLRTFLGELDNKKIHFGTGDINVQRALQFVCGLEPTDKPEGSGLLRANIIITLLGTLPDFIYANARIFRNLLIPKSSASGGGKRRITNKKLSKQTSMKGGAKRRGSKKASKKVSKKGSKKASMKGGAKRRGSKKASKKVSKKGSKKASMKGGAKRRGSKKASKKGSKSRITRK